MPTTVAPRFSGAKLRSLRDRRKMSRQVLAAKIRPNLSTATIVRWEDGKAVPRFNDVCAMAEALGVDPGYFAEAA